MKKFLGIVVLGLLLYGCATPVGQSYDLEKQYEYKALTSLVPDGFTDNFLTGATWGLYSPKLYDFYA